VKIQKKSKLNCDSIAFSLFNLYFFCILPVCFLFSSVFSISFHISTSNSERILDIWKKDKLNGEMIWKIQKNIVKKTVKIQKKSKVFHIFHIISQFSSVFSISYHSNLAIFHIFHIISQFCFVFFHIFLLFSSILSIRDNIGKNLV
jgi:hypothetical protein